MTEIMTLPRKLREPPSEEHLHTEVEVREYLQKTTSSRTLHGESYQGKLTLWGHVTCDWCRLCDSQGDLRVQSNPVWVPWTEDPLYPEE